MNAVAPRARSLSPPPPASSRTTSALALVRLPSVMELTRGDPRLVIGLIDGPVAVAHPDLAGARLREVPGRGRVTCAQPSSAACQHGTFVAGMLAARAGSAAPALCPGCTLLLRPIFDETPTSFPATLPSSTPGKLAAAILDCLEGGARILNLSVALAHAPTGGERELQGALDQSARRGVLVVAAAGNQGTIGSSLITRHPAVIPVVACD